jgi:hypothetical protein
MKHRSDFSLEPASPPFRSVEKLLANSPPMLLGRFVA